MTQRLFARRQGHYQSRQPSPLLPPALAVLTEKGPAKDTFVVPPVCQGLVPRVTSSWQEPSSLFSPHSTFSGSFSGTSLSSKRAAQCAIGMKH